ncbi:hypothetical protein B0H21DRAFT_711895 [Amylocystis lapponica]|nr:hypothetical protein B0H21DRAFT_711895 [Amylocystis lapponica]
MHQGLDDSCLPAPDVALQRFDFYALRVRSIIQQESEPYIPPHTFSALSTCSGRPTSTLLPLLHTLDVRGEHAESQVRPFISRSLHRLRISLCCNPTDCSSSCMPTNPCLIERFIIDLGHHAPLLHELELFGTGCKRSMLSIAALQSLGKLRMGNFPALTYAAALQTLVDLNLYIFADAPLRIGYPSLQRLKVSSMCSLLEGFLRCVTSRHLRSFTAEIKPCSGTDDNLPVLRRSLDLLASQFVTLQTVCLGLFGSQPGGSIALSRLVDIIRPLLRLCQLEVFAIRLDTVQTFSLTDEDIHDMATSWPRLVELTLEYDHNSIVPSLSSLADLRVHSPNLRSLELPLIDARHIPPSRPHTVTGHPLRRLCIMQDYKLVVTDDDALKRYIHYLFPLVRPLRRSA